MNNFDTILIENQEKYQQYHQVKLINKYLTSEEILPFNQSQIIE